MAGRVVVNLPSLTPAPYSTRSQKLIKIGLPIRLSAVGLIFILNVIENV